jgi:O-methyltransferase
MPTNPSKNASEEGRQRGEIYIAMKTIVILGAGQMGKNAELLLNQKEYKLLAFGDNAANASNAAHKMHEQADPERNRILPIDEERGHMSSFGTEGHRILPIDVGKCPILPVAEALALKPDLVFVAVASGDRGLALEKQARDLGYHGIIIRLDAMMEAVDIRSATAKRIAQRIIQTRVPGSIAELGVYKGDFARLLNELFADRKLYLFDTFEGFDPKDIEAEKQRGFPEANREEFADTSAEAVLEKMPYKDQVIVRKGFFPQTAEDLEDTFAFVSLDADLYAPTLAGLQCFLPRLSAGGVVLLHDYNNPRFPGVSQAVADYESTNGRLLLTPLCDMHGSAVIMQTQRRAL